MNKTKIALGIGIVLAVLVTFMVSAVPAVNAATAYFVPEDSNSSAEPGDYVYVKQYVHLEEGETLVSQQTTILFNPANADITKISKNCNPAEDDTCFNNVITNFSYTDNGYAWDVTYNPLEWDGDDWVTPSGGYFTGPKTVKICRYKVEAVGTPGVSPFNFGFEQKPCSCPICQFSSIYGDGGILITNVTWYNGTFRHEGEIQSESFEKELVSGWNLISLPLTNETNMTVANIIDESLSGLYDALYKYDATTHGFVPLSSTDTMENGVGYFINMTAGDTWTYSGSASYTSMSIGLKQGLNLVGWLNCTKQISGNLTSITDKYNYNARWNAGYEVYEPHAPEVFNDFETLERGNGYWIAAKEDCTLTVSCSG